MRCPHCGETIEPPTLYGVVGRAEGKPDVWAMDGAVRWSARTLARAQQEARERTEYARRGVSAFQGRTWTAEPLS